MAKMDMIKDVVKTGNAAKVVGGATIGLAGYGLINLGKKGAKLIGNGIDKVFPKVEPEDIDYVPEDENLEK